MGGQATLGDLVHAAGTYLYFHPFILRPHHRDMKAFVSIRFWDGDPVFHAVRVGLVHIGNDRIHLPAFRTLFFQRRIQYDTDRKQVVYPFKLDLLLFQLIINGMDRLGTPFYVELQTEFLQLLLDRCDKLGNIDVARTLRFIQLFLDEIILLRVGIFQRQIFQFALDLVKSQAVSQRGVQVRRFGSQPQPVVVLQLLAQAHQAKTVGNHNQDHPHIFGKREKQVMEVLGIDGRIACIQVGRLQQSPDDQCHVGIECLFDLFAGNDLFQNGTIEQERNHGSPFQTDLRGCDQGSIYISYQAVDAVLVSPVTVECDNTLHQLFHFPYIFFLQERIKTT